MQKMYSVNFLLTISRLPDRFFALINKLSGRDAEYLNPGVSVRSFVVGRCLRKELVLCEGQLLESIFECEQFSTNKKVLEKIMRSLLESATEIVNEINGTEDRAFARWLIPEIAALHELGTMVRLSYDSLMTIQEENEPLTIDHLPGMTFKNSLFDMQDKIEEIMNRVEYHKQTPTLPTRA